MKIGVNKGLDMRLQGAGPAHPDSYRCNREIWRLSWFCMVAYIIALMWCSVVFSTFSPSAMYPSHPGSTHYTYSSVYPLHLVSYPIIIYLTLTISCCFIFYSPAHPFRLRTHNILYPMDIYLPYIYGYLYTIHYLL